MRYKDNTYQTSVLSRLTTPVYFLLVIGLLLLLGNGCKSTTQVTQGDTLKASAQTQRSQYGTYDEQGQLIDIDVRGIFDQCEQLFFNVNVHWYLEDECRGTLDLNNEKGIDRSEAWSRSRKMIDRLNYMFERLGVNELYHPNVTDVYSAPHCVPIRMVLDDVIIHCATEPRHTSVTFREFYDYQADEDHVMNIFMSIVKTSVSGFAGGRGHMIVIEETNEATLCHEFGHNFGLSHAYQNEFSNSHTKEKCLDVYLPPAIRWDGDGDGTIDSNKPKGNCWDNKPGGDENNNGVGDYCEGIYADNPHPCCDWKRQDNNLMISSAWAKNPEYAAITSCQTEYMLDQIQKKKIQYITQVGGCPPPRAILGVAPSHPDASASTVVHLEASSNATYHQVNLFDKEGQLLKQGEIVKSAPQAIDLSAIKDVPLLSIDSISLLVANDCGQVHQRGLSLNSSAFKK